VTPGRVAILGLGLMGGSLGLALKALADPPHVTGYDSDPATARRARERRAVDAVAAGTGEAASGADVIALAVPPRAVGGILDSIGPGDADRAVIADLSSVMRPLQEALASRPALAPRAVSSHPLCGSERAGIEEAAPDLYRGSTVLIGSTGPSRESGERIAALWRRIGAEPRAIDPGTHDALLALTSHLPFLASVALARALRASGHPAPELAGASGPGLRDATRLAASPPGLWEEIVTLNAGPLGPALELLESAVGELRRALRSGDPSVRAMLEEVVVFVRELRR
jgi:prephenate dehydrogenase